MPLCKNNDAYMKYQWRALPCTSMAEFNDACTRYPWSDFLYDLMTVNCPETCGFCGCEDDNVSFTFILRILRVCRVGVLNQFPTQRRWRPQHLAAARAWKCRRTDCARRCTTC